MSTPIAGNYTNGFFSKFSLVRKYYYISGRRIEIPRIEYQASGIICLITSVAMICLAALKASNPSFTAFNPLIGSVVIISGSILCLAVLISSFREAFARNSIADKFGKEIMRQRMQLKYNLWF
ncbi:MAG: hypothetical protein KR126chlam6_00582 [Candidatus Anoxychlamydiales bacterium]|nr:hypothetical protein [Candidatus Anoxychlamydiales bacterium]